MGLEGIQSAPWFDKFAKILSQLEADGIWREGKLEAFFALNPTVDGDATLLRQRPSCVLRTVYRLWSSALQVSGGCQEGTPQLYADNLKCVSSEDDDLLAAASFIHKTGTSSAK